MRFVYGSALIVSAALLVPTLTGAQGQTETARKIEGGGISVAGWSGRIDDSETKAGQVLNNAKLAMDGAALHVTTGPAVTYWNPANIYGIRFAHNTEALVSGLAVMKN
jgi:hypothetical protein